MSVIISQLSQLSSEISIDNIKSGATITFGDTSKSYNVTVINGNQVSVTKDYGDAKKAQTEVSNFFNNVRHGCFKKAFTNDAVQIQTTLQQKLDASIEQEKLHATRAQQQSDIRAVTSATDFANVLAKYEVELTFEDAKLFKHAYDSLKQGFSEMEGSTMTNKLFGKLSFSEKQVSRLNQLCLMAAEFGLTKGKPTLDNNLRSGDFRALRDLAAGNLVTEQIASKHHITSEQLLAEVKQVEENKKSDDLAVMRAAFAEEKAGKIKAYRQTIKSVNSEFEKQLSIALGRNTHHVIS